MQLHFLLPFLLAFGEQISARPPVSNEVHIEQLRRQVSSDASVTNSSGAPLRWSTYKQPIPAIVVNVANENDVANTIKYCNSQSLPFLISGGAVGWSTTPTLRNTGVLLNLAALSTFSVSAARNQATIGGGSKIKQTIDAAYAAGVQVVTGNCNCVGTLGALLGGGLGNLAPKYGLSVDQVISLRTVLADGSIKTVTRQSDPELFWGLRGAGPNLGVVVSATIRAYPVPQDKSTGWSALLTFPSSKLEALVTEIERLELGPENNVFMYFAARDFNPANSPNIALTLFSPGNTDEGGRRAYKPLYDLGPETESARVIPYNTWNAGADGLCTRNGERKPSVGVSFQNMQPKAWRKAWDAYEKFQKQPGAGTSIVLLERYNLTKTRTDESLAGEASFPFKGIQNHALALSWYSDEKLDDDAVEFGKDVRKALRKDDGVKGDATYINFGFGDEDLETVYGGSLQRLKRLKKSVDPENRFNQWFPLK